MSADTLVEEVSVWIPVLVLVLNMRRLADEDAVGHVMKALAEPRRRAILRLVASDELAAGEIAGAFDVTRTAVSQHLTVLREAGLLEERRDGTRRLYRARPEGLADVRELLDDLWAASLDVARRLVEREVGATVDSGVHDNLRDDRWRGAADGIH